MSDSRPSKESRQLGALPSGALPSGSTRVAAVIGSPIRHSLSPVMFNAAFLECDLDWVFVAFDVAAGAATEALAALRALHWGGMSVTMPHKADVAALVDSCSPSAEILGAVNCVVPGADGALHGENTDGAGIVGSLRADLDFDPAGRRAVVVGAGGAARAIVLGLAAAGASDVVVVNRTAGHATVAAAIAEPVGRVGAMADIADADLVVNATSVGMTGNPGCPVDLSLLRRDQVVVDIVYDPVETELLSGARSRGCATADGVGMLVHQGARAFELWTGIDAPVGAMRSAARARVDAR